MPHRAIHGFRGLALAAALILVILALAVPSPARADYPVVPHRYAADPTALAHDGRLYVYCSNDDENTSTSYDMKSITCFSTADLKNWTDHGIVFDARRDTHWAWLSWAPSVVERNGTFYLYFTNGAGNIGVVTSSSPTGPFTDPRGSALVSSATPGAAGDQQWYLDPAAFVDDDGQAYLYFGGRVTGNDRVIKLNEDMISVNGAAQPTNAPSYFEAPYMHKFNGRYYYTYSSTPPAEIYCMTSTTSPISGFTPQQKILFNNPDNYGNNNHSSIAEFKGNWYIVYHNRVAATERGVEPFDHMIVQRNLCIDQLFYNPDGTIKPVAITRDGLTQLQSLDPFARVEAETTADSNGIKTEPCSEGGMDVTSIGNGDWIRVRGVDFGTTATFLHVRVASAGDGGSIELRLDRPDGPLGGTCFVPNTGGAQTWTTVYCGLQGVTGLHDAYLRFKGPEGDNLFNVNWWQVSDQPVEIGSQVTLPDPVHRYLFDETGGSTAADAIGSANGSLPSGGTLANGNLALSGSNQYLDLPDGLVSSLSDVTIATWVNVNAIGTWSRIFDFGSGTGNYMFLTPRAGTNGPLRFAITTGGGEQQISATSALGAGAWHFVAVTLGGNTGTLYLDGQQVGRNTNLTLNPSNLGNTTQNWVGRSQWVADPYLNASLNDFRIYDSALSADQIAALYVEGGGQLFGNTAPEVDATLDAAATFQTIEGIGGALCFWNGVFTGHPYKKELYDLAFSGLNISMLRLGNWWRNTNGTDSTAYEFVAEANKRLAEPVPILMSSWSPPANLKSNGTTGGGGTLIGGPGNYDYNGFANYWLHSLQDYANHGIVPTWISIQNEPDWTADYDSCRFNPTEAPRNGESFASYASALHAVHDKLQALASPPKILGPEVVGLNFSPTAQFYRDFIGAMDPNDYYGMAHHLYGGSTNGTPDGYIPVMNGIKNLVPGKPGFMTEFGYPGMIDEANLLHNTFAIEGASGYNHWTLMWPDDTSDPGNPDNIGLIVAEFASDRANWRTPHGYYVMPAYWAMKHYSYYIRPGYKRVAIDTGRAGLLTSAYISPDSNRVVVVAINQSSTDPVNLQFNSANFAVAHATYFQSAGANHWEEQGAVPPTGVPIPVRSVTTILLDKEVPIGAATNPTPATGAIDVPSGTALAWTPGAGATGHNVYLGTDYAAVANATTASPEFQGSAATASFVPPSGLASGTTYYWRVDETALSSVARGPIWSFTVRALQPEAYLPFNEASGATATDAMGHGWNGTLNGGATFVAGRLGNAVDLAGDNDYVRLPNGVVSGMTRMTIMTWVRLDAISNWSRLFDFGSNTTTNMFLTPTTGGAVRFAITTGGSGGEQRITGSAPLPTGQWVHVAVTLNGPTGILYVNGQEVGRNTGMTLTPASLGTTTNNYIGRSQYNDPYLNGQVDDFRIYADALGAGEIAAIAGVAANHPPAFKLNPVVVHSAVANYAYSGFSVASGAEDPDAGDLLRFSKVGGPAWLQIAPDGTLSGTPGDADAGTNSFTVRVTDQAGQTAEAEMQMVVFAEAAIPATDWQGYE